MEELLKPRHGTQIELYGAYSPVDLSMARGTSHYVDSPDELLKFNDLYICGLHLKELYTRWSSQDFRHILRTQGI